MTDRMLAAALAYAERGWAVLPLRVRGKAPAIPKCRGGAGYFGATTDLETIERLWREYPDANVGVSCIGSGFVALDVDPRHRGDRTLAEIESRYAPLPHTVRQLTGGGGEHILLGAPRDLQPRGSIGAGIDVKWRGFIVVSPSIHPDTGRRYTWASSHHPLHTPIAQPPAWLIDLLAPPPRTLVGSAGDFRPTDSPQIGNSKARYAGAALRRAAVRVASAPVGQRNSILNVEAYGVGRFVREGLIEPQVLADTLAAAAIAAGEDRRKVVSTLTSALRARGI